MMAVFEQMPSFGSSVRLQPVFDLFDAVWDGQRRYTLLVMLCHTQHGVEQRIGVIVKKLTHNATVYCYRS